MVSLNQKGKEEEMAVDLRIRSSFLGRRGRPIVIRVPEAGDDDFNPDFFYPIQVPLSCYRIFIDGKVLRFQINGKERENIVSKQAAINLATEILKKYRFRKGLTSLNVTINKGELS